MRLHVKIAVAGATMALGAAPALAVASGPGNSGSAPGHNKTTSVATPTQPPPKAESYGKLCQSESKKHVAGTPGTPFSACVKAMAKLADGSTTSPRAACTKESRKHVHGTPGTPYSLCVSAAAKLLGEKHESPSDATPSTT